MQRESNHPRKEPSITTFQINVKLIFKFIYTYLIKTIPMVNYKDAIFSYAKISLMQFELFCGN